MKSLKYIKTSILLGLTALAFASCDDFLTVYPQDRVVEENFWEDKTDLQGVRYAAYHTMCGENWLRRAIIWGDLRSDSYELLPRTSSRGQWDNFNKIMLGQLDTTYQYGFDWSVYYTAINYCNMVLIHGPEVLENDRQFTSTEWKEMRAEITALRALNYFYLIRAFKDVPYTDYTDLITKDTQVRKFGAIKQMAVLDTLIHQVRPIAGQARNSFSSVEDTKGLMTNAGIYALLADMYLWRSALREGHGYDEALWKADCDSVIEFGNLSLNALQSQIKTNMGASLGNAAVDDYGNTYLTNAPLIKNESMTNTYNTATSKTPITVDSYDQIFKAGNSREEIFALQFDGSNTSNGQVGMFWGNADGSYLKACEKAIKAIYGANDTKFAADSRSWYGAQANIVGKDPDHTVVLKWYDNEFTSANKKVSAETEASTTAKNWPIYRQTDVMLMIAEALAARNESGDQANCRMIVNAIHKRSTAGSVTADIPGATTGVAITSRDVNIKLVLNERQIELIGEGKRWFDLVRYAERYANGKITAAQIEADAALDPADRTIAMDPYEPMYTDGSEGVKLMIDAFMKNKLSDSQTTALRIRIQNRWGLYCPIYYMERSANREGEGAEAIWYLEQNPVWKREK